MLLSYGRRQSGKVILTNGLLMRRESEKVGLKINIQKTKIMTSGPMKSWQIDGGKVET